MVGLFSWYRLLAICAVVHEITSAVENLKCRDWNNKEVEDGQEFSPNKEDLCKVCVCNKGFEERCKSVSCATPPCEHYVAVVGECCQFTCTDSKIPKSNRGGDGTPNYTQPVDTGNNSDGSSDSITTLGLRLVASTVTSFLVLALLLFMVHRIRQRRIMLAARRYHNNRRLDQLDELDHGRFTQEYIGIQSPPPYEDPPPPYSPPKPHPRILPSESPPPYEAVDSNQNINNNNNNNDVQCQTDQSHMLHMDGHYGNVNIDNALHCNNSSHNSSSAQSSRSPVRSDSYRTVGSSRSDSCRTVGSSRSDSCRTVGSSRSDSCRTVGSSRSDSYRTVGSTVCSNVGNISLAISGLSSKSQNAAVNTPSNSSSVISSSSTYRPNTSASVQPSFPNYLDQAYFDSARNAESFRPKCPVTMGTRQPFSSNKQHVLDRADDSSSVASESLSPYLRRPYPGSCVNDLRGYFPPYHVDGTDSDDLSTEASANVSPFYGMFHSLQVRNRTENSAIPHSSSTFNDIVRKPAKICYIDGDANRTNAEKQQNGANGYQPRDNLDVNKTSPNVQTDFLASFSGEATNRDGLGSEQLDIQDISVSEVGTSSSDIGTGKDLRDNLQLRELRLSNLLRSPDKDSPVDPLSPLSQRYLSHVMTRSVSDASMFSVCSETGEKKLSQLTGVAIRNDAPYPESISKGRASVPVALPVADDMINQLDTNAVNNVDMYESLRTSTSEAKESSVCKAKTKNRKPDRCSSVKEGEKVHNAKGHGKHMVKRREKVDKLKCDATNRTDSGSSTVVSMGTSRCSGSSMVSECSNSSGEKTCVSDKKYLIKAHTRPEENCATARKEIRVGNKKKNLPESGVALRYTCKNKHKAHRHSTGSCTKSKRRSVNQDAPESYGLPPPKISQEYASGFMNDKSSPPSYIESEKSAAKARIHEEYGCTDNAKIKKGVNPKKMSSTIESSKQDIHQKVFKTPLMGNDFNYLRDPTNLQENVNANFAAIEKLGKLSENSHACDRQCVHKTSKSQLDSSLLCPGKGFVRRRSRNSKRNKNRRSYPGAHIVDSKVKGVNAMSSSFCSYKNGVKKETEFSSDGVREKLTFAIPSGTSNQDDVCTVERCSYV